MDIKTAQTLVNAKESAYKEWLKLREQANLTDQQRLELKGLQVLFNTTYGM